MKALTISIFLGFLARVYFTSSGRWEYSRETASKKVTITILFMVAVSLFFNAHLLDIPANIKDTITGICAAIYFVIALFDSVVGFESDSTWMPFIKLCLLFLVSVSKEICMIFVSIVFLVGSIYLYKKRCIVKDEDKIIFAEIILLCVENIIIALTALFFLGGESILSILLLVSFEETVLYSINYTIIFAVKEKIYSFKY